ncbi:MAG: peptidylprolyl isomerase [Ferruginibacter sp.]
MKYAKKLFLLFILPAFSCKSFAQQNIHCLIKSTLGDITIELHQKKAPITVANFLSYVDAHLYNNTSFFRAVTLKNQPDNKIKIEVIQGGDVDSTKEFAPIPMESTKQTGIVHQNGTMSMARSAPASATCNFFICINDQPSLDYGGKRNPDGQGFAAFGKVIKGMDVVKKIQQLYPKQGQYFKPVVKIISITRIP